MSRRFLPVTAAALLLAVLGLEVADARAAQKASPAHRELLCVTCHAGALSDRPQPHVPNEVCVGCHAVDALAGGEMGFDHLAHGGVETVEIGCVGCHNHESGTADLSAGRGECVLCHQPERNGAGEAECRTCHRQLPAQARTSQGVELPHGVFQWIGDTCLRCHYALSAPPAGGGRCAPCHEDGRTAAASERGGDLHREHVQVACRACHDVGPHRIEGMSAAVSLPCGDCHGAPHHLSPRWAGEGAGVCDACHESVHQAQQRLFLGVVGGQLGTLVSPKFLSGVSCRSCHGDGDGREDHHGDPDACAGCHEPRYGRVADWWKAGGAERAAAVREYATGAGRALGSAGLPPDAAGLEEARAWIRLVETGGAQHNPALGHRLLGEALLRARDAYRTAGAIVPAPPTLGAEPRPGQCAYCHYDIPFQGLETFQEAPHAFHFGAVR